MTEKTATDNTVIEDAATSESSSRGVVASSGVANEAAGVAASDADRCVQCDLPNPGRGTVEHQGQRFCCNGCVTAYHILSASGLQEALENPEFELPGKERARPTGNRYQEFDDPSFTQLYVTVFPLSEEGVETSRKGSHLGVSDQAVAEWSPDADDEPSDPWEALGACHAEVEFWLEGVHCVSCLRLLEHLPDYLPGVISSRLNLRNNLLTLKWDPAAVQLSRIATTLDSLGYPCHPLRGKSRRELQQQQERQQLLQLALAGALAGNTMLVSIALYAGMFEGMAAAHESLFRWVSLGLGTVSLVFPGRTFFQGAWSALRTRTSHMDLPIALGLAAGGIAGIVNTIRGAGEIYFDSLTVLVFFLLVGRFLQMRQQRRAGDSIELLYSLTPSSARRVSPSRRRKIEAALAPRSSIDSSAGQSLSSDVSLAPGDSLADEASDAEVRVVPVQALQPGEWVEVRAQDSVPVDGRIVWGASSVDTSLLTGESLPVPVGPGDHVAAGATNRGASFVVQVEATGESTRVGKLMKLVESAAAEKAPVAQLADRLGAWFVIVVMLLALGTYAYWSWQGSVHALEHAIALLIVACPCALGLATPLTLAVMIGRAARRRILIRGADVVEALAHRGRIYLDKTGTLTEGAFQLREWIGPAEVQSDVVALQRQSSHPLALAFVASLADQVQDEPQEVSDVEQDPRGGIHGVVQGRCVAVGNEAFFGEQGIEVPSDVRRELSEQAAHGRTPVMIAVQGQLVAVAAFGDALRSDAVQAVRELKQQGWEVGILSGDHPRVVEAVAEAAGIEPRFARGAMTPEEKLSVVRESPERGSVVMVGDGVNDAAALAAASVGIAVKTGAEASLEAAPVYLGREGLRPIVDLMRAARRTMFTVRAGLLISLMYNAFAVLLAMLGLISPLVAAVLMPLSSLTVVGLSFSPRTFPDVS